MVLLFRLENRDLVLWTPSEMHHFRIFIFLIVVFLRRRADRLGGAAGGGGGGRGSLGGWMWDLREGGGSPGPPAALCVRHSLSFLPRFAAGL